MVMDLPGDQPGRSVRLAPAEHRPSDDSDAGQPPRGGSDDVTDWTTLAARLADELVRLGKVRSPQWQAAVRAVPRHELVPVQHLYDPVYRNVDPALDR